MSCTNCIRCGDAVDAKRVELGYKVCLPCGEDAAIAEREGWTVIQEYGKGNYQFVTSTKALQTLRETNQKGTR